MSRSLDILTEACEGLPVTVRRMFGGHGFFAPNGGMFAGIVTDDEAILKLVAGPARDELIAAGGHPWTWTGGPRPMTMSEWIVVPDAFYDDVETFAVWARRACELVPPRVAKVGGSRSGGPGPGGQGQPRRTPGRARPRARRRARSAPDPSAPASRRAGEGAELPAPAGVRGGEPGAGVGAGKVPRGRSRP